MSCSAMFCKSRTAIGGEKNPEISFHCFPKCPEIRSEWIKAVRRDINGLSIRKLKYDAIPTIFEGYPLYYKPALKRKPPKNRNQIPHTSTHITEDKVEKSSAKLEEIATMAKEAVKLKRDLQKSRSIALKRLQKIKSLRQCKRRLLKKNATLINVINDLKSKCILDTDSIDLLKTIGCKSHDLLVRLKRKLNNEQLPKKYSPELRKFALTLHFLSPRAYKYVRDNFDSCLPHSKTISKWYQVIDCEPGFTKESFEALKIRCQKTTIIGALSIDEMAIRKCIEWDGHRSHGYVNVGNHVEDDSIPVATEVLTFMVTAVNGSFKIPVGYFFINGVVGLQKAALVRACLDLLMESGVTIVSLTFDGAPNNQVMAKHLGCNLNYKTNLNTQFEHNGSKISIFLDPCHSLKLVRNTLGDKGIMYNKEGKEISFKYFQLLHNLQIKEQLHLANKLRQPHIDYINQKMKVKLAAQLFSQSVSDALMFCRNEIKLVEFQDCEATCEFICIFNNLFDILNSRNINSYGYKQAILPRNLEKTYRLIENGVDYIKNLKLSKNELIIDSQRKTGFLGFLICLQSLKNLCDHLLMQQSPKLKFIRTYKFSQDHIELFFGAIRAMGGYNNNHSAKQFRAAYKKLIIHAEFKISEGNCIPLENIPILNISKNTNFVKMINTTLSKYRLIEEFEEISQNDSLTNDDHTYLNDPTQLTEYILEIIYYLAGFVIKKIKSTLMCENCLSALEGKKKISLTSIKDKGGLIYPSDDVYNICKLCEKLLRRTLIITHYSRINDKDIHKMIRDVILQTMYSANYKNIFQSLENHVLDFNFWEDHKYLLIKSICEKYFQLRINFVMKNAVAERSVRNTYTKLILFKGQ